MNKRARGCSRQVILEKTAVDKGQPPPPPDAARVAEPLAWELALTEPLRAEEAAAAEEEAVERVQGAAAVGVEVLVRVPCGVCCI